MVQKKWWVPQWTIQNRRGKKEQSANNRRLRELHYKSPNPMPFFSITAHLKKLTSIIINELRWNLEHSNNENFIFNWWDIFQMSLIIYTTFISLLFFFIFWKRFWVIIMKYYNTKPKEIPISSEQLYFQPSIHLS